MTNTIATLSDFRFFPQSGVFYEKELIAQMGFGRGDWPKALLKELEA